jgi:hypothetical protein
VLPDRDDQLLGALSGQAVVRSAQAAADAFALVLKADAPVGALNAVAIRLDADGAEEFEFPFTRSCITAFYAIIGVNGEASYAKLVVKLR